MQSRTPSTDPQQGRPHNRSAQRLPHCPTPKRQTVRPAPTLTTRLHAAAPTRALPNGVNLPPPSTPNRQRRSKARTRPMHQPTNGAAPPLPPGARPLACLFGIQRGTRRCSAAVYAPRVWPRWACVHSALRWPNGLIRGGKEGVCCASKRGEAGWRSVISRVEGGEGTFRLLGCGWWRWCFVSARGAVRGSVYCGRQWAMCRR